MEWTQFVIFFISVFGLFVWNRAESRADARHMDSKLESNRNLSMQIHKENLDLINAIREDIRDFHGRLCSIEEKNKNGK
jgi:hypothetical protein